MDYAKLTFLKDKVKNMRPLNERGFSLVELLVVVVIIGLMMFLFVNLPSTIALVKVSWRSSIAKDIAIEKMEQLRSQSLPPNCNNCSFTHPRASELPNPDLKYTVENCPPSICFNGEDVTKTKKVTVTVAWQEPGETKMVKMETLVTEGGL